MRSRLTVARRLLGALCGVVLAGGLLTPVPSATAAVPLPATLTHIGAANQVIIVHSSRWATSYATLEAWQKSSSGTWTRRYLMSARIGYGGFVNGTQRRQNTGTTPTGTYSITQAFGNNANPGALLPYRRVDSNDVWAYDPRCPSTYNRWINWYPGRCERVPDWAEKLSSYKTQYAYAAIINFNTTNPVLTRGGGIFLHVNGSGATAGCVSVTSANMVTLTRWMRPGVKIVMGPTSTLSRS